MKRPNTTKKQKKVIKMSSRSNSKKAKRNKVTTSKSPLARMSQRPVLVALAIVAVSVLGFIIFKSFAGTPGGVLPSVATSDCGARVSNYTYKVPFGNAPWNVPVCNLPRHPRSAEFVSRLYNYAFLNDGSATALSRRGKFNVAFGFEEQAKNWTRAVYYAKDATTTRKVQTCTNKCTMSNFDDGKGVYDIEAWLPNREFPWNPSWETAEGGDNELLIIDEDKGHIYSFASVKTGLAAQLQCAPYDSKRLCASSARIMRDHNRNVADYRTFEGSDGSRGGGINFYATLLTPQEVKAGEIRHALGMNIFNSPWGPICTKEQMSVNDPQVVDVTCGTAVAPAAKFELPNSRSIGDHNPSLKGQPINSIMTLSKTVPHGMRFALDIDEDDIDKWINSRADLKSNPRKAQTARIIARALRDYGWMPLDTSGFGAAFQVAGGMSKANRALWQELGITSTEDDNLLHGLFTESNMYVVDTPVNNCVDGTKLKFYCPYTSSRYPSTTSSTPSTPPTKTPSPTVTSSSTTTPKPSTTPPTPTTTPSPSPSPTNTPIPGTPDTTPPSTPRNLVRQIQFDVSRMSYYTTLSWTASSDDRGVVGYQIQKDNGSPTTVSTNTYRDYQVVANWRYQYKVWARDGAGNMSKSATTEFTTKCFLIWCWAE